MRSRRRRLPPSVIGVSFCQQDENQKEEKRVEWLEKADGGESQLPCPERAGFRRRS